VLALGNSGTGKTHIGLALGLAACQQGFRVRFTTAAALVHELIEARDEKRGWSPYDTAPDGQRGFPRPSAEAAPRRA
jgi:DNA replication protein DnaC